MYRRIAQTHTHTHNVYVEGIAKPQRRKAIHTKKKHGFTKRSTNKCIQI